MKPHSFILAKNIELFAGALYTNIEFMQHITGEAYYYDYRDLTDIAANPYDKDLKHAAAKAKDNKTSPEARIIYRNTVMRHHIYNQIVQRGALCAFHQYYPTENDAYKTFETDQVLYRSYVITHEDDKRKKRLSATKIAQQEKALKQFPKYQEIAKELIDIYYHPKTKEERDIVSGIKNAVIVADIYNGHLFSSNENDVNRNDIYHDNKIITKPYVKIAKSSLNDFNLS